MDLNRLDANEKLAVYGSVAVIVGGIIGAGIGGLGILAVLAAVGMLAIVFLPQFSPTTTLPGSKGSLMLIAGGIAAAVMILALLSILSVLGAYLEIATLNALLFLVAVVGGLVMGWAGWQAFKAEGGTFTVGAPGGGPASGSTTRTSTSRADGPTPLDTAARDATVREPGDDRPAAPTA